MNLRTGLVFGAVAVLLASHAKATVFINEVFINPPGGLDTTSEFIELMGTPGKKLDGYAIAFLNGGVRKIFAQGTITSPNNPPGDSQEVDEFFSLDGLSLGANGILVLAITNINEFPTVVADSNFQDWNVVWNGPPGTDLPGRLQNDGSNTIMLVRNRPGATEADPSNPAGGIWAKDGCHDCELIAMVEADVCVGGIVPGLPCSTDDDCLGGMCLPGFADQWGDGNLDKGQTDGFGGNTLDFKGASTVLDITDDLEIVDEVSYEQDQGWEYDEDDRHSDLGLTSGGLRERRVHALGDPQGFNPDCLTRVDYRTKGDGWAPAPGGTGEMMNGNNWQDTATEQWIRGESVLNFMDERLYYDNADNTDPNAIQPFQTQVPLWLDDGLETDYDFSTTLTYAIKAGQVNAFAVPYIPGDADRDGDADQDDIDKIATLFGSDDFIFSNGFEDAPEGDGGDPATQTRPWDVDMTGDNGIEASDLQWTLNFLGSANGRIAGVTYDDGGPAATGVALNDPAGVSCTVTASANVPSGNPMSALAACDVVEITVRGQVTAGANGVAGDENGIMQFVHDLMLSSSGVLEVASIEALGAFATTNASIQTLAGVSGDLGATNLNGYSTSFTEGLAAPADLYRVTLIAAGMGTVDVMIGPAAETPFANGTPAGLKIGHTLDHGNPESAVYPAAITMTVVSDITTDVNNDAVSDLADVAAFADVLLGIDLAFEDRSDFNCDGLANGADIQPFLDRFLP